MRVLITGAAGFVGRHLVPELARDHDVIAVVRTAGPPSPSVVTADLRDPEFVRALPDSVDAIVHLAQGGGAFPGDAVAIFDATVSSTARLADYAVRAGVRTFILASTGSVYARTTAPLSEESPVAADTYNAATKLASEALLTAYASDLSSTILRIFVPYGPGQAGRMIPSIVGAVSESRPVVVTNGGQPRSNPIFVDDLCVVIGALLERPYAGILNVAGPQVVSIHDVARLAGEAVRRAPVIEERTAPERWDLIAETERLRRHLPDIAWTTPQEGIQRMVAEGMSHA